MSRKWQKPTKRRRTGGHGSLGLLKYKIYTKRLFSADIFQYGHRIKIYIYILLKLSNKLNSTNKCEQIRLYNEQMIYITQSCPRLQPGLTGGPTGINQLRFPVVKSDETLFFVILNHKLLNPHLSTLASGIQFQIVKPCKT